MIELPVHDRQGKVLETLQFDESCLGKFINIELMHQAIVMFEANQRQGTHSTKNRRSIVGGGKKPFRQKGTGRARQGSARRVGSVGGALAHGPVPRDYTLDMPKKARRNALKSALLSKFRDSEVVVVDKLEQKAPKTKDVAATLNNLKIDGSCLVVTKQSDDTLWKSLRNIASTELTQVAALNTYQVLKPKKILITKDALEAIPEEMK